MNQLRGEILEIFIEEGSTIAMVRVDGTMLRVPLLLLMNARVGDEIVIDAGIAVARAAERGPISKQAR